MGKGNGKTAEIAEEIATEPLTLYRIPQCEPCARSHRNHPRRWDSNGTTARRHNMERSK